MARAGQVGWAMAVVDLDDVPAHRVVNASAAARRAPASRSAVHSPLDEESVGRRHGVQLDRYFWVPCQATPEHRDRVRREIDVARVDRCSRTDTASGCSNEFWADIRPVDHVRRKRALNSAPDDFYRRPKPLHPDCD
jgi:hypothetical protein